MQAWNFLGELIALLGLALLFGLAARRLGQKPILGYLIAGILCGPKAFGLIRSVEEIRFLSELGVALLLYSIGLEFSWHRLQSLGRAAVIAGTLQISLTFAFGALAAVLLRLPFAGAVAAGGILSLSSTAFVIRILQDRTEMDSRHGRIAVGILLLQDLALIPLLILQSVAAEGRSGSAALLDFAIQLGRGALLVGLIYLVIRLVLLRAFRGAGSYAEREIPILLSVSACLGCAWASHLAGLSPALGAFVAGLLLADQPAADQIRANTAPLQTVFLTLFFSSIGMMATIPRGVDLLWVPLLALLIVGVKTLLTTGAIRLAGLPSRPALLGGLALAQIGEFSFVLAEDAARRAILPETWTNPLIAASVLTLFLAPYLLSTGSRLLEHQPPAAPAPAPRAVENSAIIVGFGPAGQSVFHELATLPVDLAVIDSNADLLARIEGARTFLGDATSVEILEHAGIASARTLIITVPDPSVARTIIGLARSLAPDLSIIVRARYHRFADPLRRLGAETVVDEEAAVGRMLAEQAAARLQA